MVQNIVSSFYPDLRKGDARKYGLLAIILFLIIGTYWCLRLLKNTIFLYVAFPTELGWASTAGIHFQPTAKIISPWFVLTLVLIYSKLVDLFKRHQLFYILCSVYSILFSSIAIVLLLAALKGPAFVGKIPLAATGWISYFTIESFGSLIVVLFWSFTNSISDPNSAKRGFPFIVTMAQVGAIIGSVAVIFSKSIPLWMVLIAASILTASVMPLIHYFMKTTPKEELVGYQGGDAEKKTDQKKEGFLKGFVSGLVLLVTRPYLLGVLVISTVYEAVAQIVEYQMNSVATGVYDKGSYTQFMGWYGVSVNVLALLIALLGTSYLLKRFGVRVSLLIYPTAFGFILFGIYLYSLGVSTTQLLWPLFSAMVLIKGLAYAVNNPTKEMMYIPTSKDAKFKSKSWIDTFGSRQAKAGGAGVTNTFKNNLPELMLYGTIFGLGLIVIWLVAAFYVGRKNTKLVKNGEIIG